MEIPLTEKDIDKILKILKNSNEKELYAKLWTFKFRKIINDGLS